MTTQPSGSLHRPRDVGVAVVGAWEVVRVSSADSTEAAELVFRTHYAPLAGWCRRMVGDTDIAHDIAAEAFVRLLGRWTTVTDPRAYLYTTALNLVRDRWRRSERERVAMGKVVTSASAEPSQAPGPELRMLVEALPQRLQQVVVLYYFADMTVDSVARALGVAPGTVKRDLYDARAKLAKALAQA
jgi:RNA polymerase sigma-70 factor (ECF subfamily)